MSEEKSTTQWVDVNYIQQHYLPISKKAIRKMLKENLDIAIQEIVNDFRTLIKDYFEPYVGSSGTITLDYKNGFAYNKFPGYKAAIDNPSIDVQYDEVTTPKIIEQTIEFIAQKKVTMNEILQFSDQDD